MSNLVFLPATEPHDETYGRIPERIETFPDVSVYQVRYPTMVWYNESVRGEAIAQIDALNIVPFVLVGFSKSGFGAWNITRTIPDRISATIIFDAPVAREEPHPWGTALFYDSDAAWREDLPILTAGHFKAAVPKTHKLVLISGKAFHDEMCRLSDTLTITGVNHLFLPRPNLRHHWQSGWIEEGLQALLRKGEAPTEPGQ